MVWHALLLNPKDYEKYVKEAGLKYIHTVRFPWAEIVG